MKSHGFKRYRYGLAVLVLLAVSGVALPGHASLVAIQWSEEKDFAHQTAVAPRGVVEVCGTLTTGQGVGWQFEADAPLDFNIHYHEDTEVSYTIRQKNVAELAGELVVTREHAYCWMWTNKQSRPVNLELILRQTEQ